MKTDCLIAGRPASIWYAVRGSVHRKGSDDKLFKGSRACF